jgi:predicted SAM-dependent methyltransferase
VLELSSVRSVARDARHFLSSNVRHLRHVDKRLVDDYHKRAPVRKLHIGCGSNVISGWLNADYYPKSPNILHLDATRPFSLLESRSFDYVFSEHMIEHVPYRAGSQMIAECYRILKPDGKLRISTPDLSFLIDLYRSDKSELQQQYVAWASSRINWAPYQDETFVINNFVRNWGHSFIYDEKTLRAMMEAAGFKNVSRCGLAHSDDETLCSLENEKKMPEGFLQLESLTLEAIKK